MRITLRQWTRPLVLLAALTLYTVSALYLWQALAPQPRFTIEAPCLPAAFTHDGRYVVTYRHWQKRLEPTSKSYCDVSTGPVQVWNLRTGEPVFFARPDQREIYGAKLSPDDRWLAVPERDDPTREIRLHIFDLRSGKEQRVFDVPMAHPTEFWIYYCFSPDGRRIAYTAMDKRGPTLIGDVLGEAPPKALDGVHPPFVFAPDSKVLAALAPAERRADPRWGEVWFYNLATGKVQDVYRMRKGMIASDVCEPLFSPDGRTLALTCVHADPKEEGCALGAWDVGTHRELLWLDDATAEHFSPDGKTLVVWHGLNQTLIDTATWTERTVIPAEEGVSSEVVYPSGAQTPLLLTSNSWNLGPESLAQKYASYLGFLPFFRVQAKMTVAVRNVATQEILALRHHGGICKPFLAPDGSTLLISVQPDQFTKPVLQVWDVPQPSHLGKQTAAVGTLTFVFAVGFWFIRRRRMAV
jgi:WD40 repeat protein